MKTILTFFVSLFLCSNLYSKASDMDFEITWHRSIEDVKQKKGRLFFTFSKEKPVEKFTGIYYPDLKMMPVYAVDISHQAGKDTMRISGDQLYGFPIKTIKELPEGTWYIQALFKPYQPDDATHIIYESYSEPILIDYYESNVAIKIKLSLIKEVKPKAKPNNRKHFKYETIKSQLLSDFWQKPMFTSFQVVLPKSYFESKRNYPLLVMIGGFGERYYHKLIREKELFDEETPEMLMVLLDGKGPYGDPYQVNSDNNGPYGDVLINEVIPHIESTYRGIGNARGRFLTGTSTGGWSSLALQIYYPDFFNGVWSTCADPVDFRQMELIDIYNDKNAFVSRHGMERPAMRDSNGEPRHSVRTEVWSENLMGKDNSFHMSKGQWGSWNAVFSPRDSLTGEPMKIFDPETGEIDSLVAKAWERYDLRKVLSENWGNIGLKLKGKLHIWMGTMDSYYLNNAMVLMDRFLKSTANPKSDAEINFICGEGHACDSQIPLVMMMKQMIREYEAAN